MAMSTLCVSFGQKVFGLSNQHNILTGQPQKRVICTRHEQSSD